MSTTLAPISIQLYTVRVAMAKDFAGTVRQIAEIGYVGVETAGFPGTTPEAAARLFRNLGLQVSAMHVQLPLSGETLDAARALGCTRLISSPGKDYYQNLTTLQQGIDLCNAAGATAQANGMTFGIHNHWWEFARIDGKYGYDILAERLAPAVFFEVDVYWAQTAGADPVPLVRKLGARAPLLHLKDGPCTIEAPMVAVGSGVVDIPAVVQAGSAHTEWLIVELDRCATDMMDAVRQSYRYLVGNKLARGHKPA